MTNKDDTANLLINQDNIGVRGKMDYLPMFLTHESLMDISVGDTVKVVCKDRALIKDTGVPKTFVGTVKSVFNAFDNDGDNWIYELKGSRGEWFLYKPSIDGGTITVIQKAKD